MLRRAGFLDEAHPAMDLDAEARDLAADIGAPRLGQRSEHFGPRAGIGSRPPAPGRPGRTHNKSAPARPSSARASASACAARRDARRSTAGWRSRWPWTRAERIVDRALGRALGDSDALQSDVQPRIVHHREHRPHAAMLGTEQPAGRPALDRRKPSRRSARRGCPAYARSTRSERRCGCRREGIWARRTAKSRAYPRALRPSAPGPDG